MLVKSAPQRGFTLIELMTTIAVLVVLALVAMPSFRQFVANQRVRNASFELMSALTLARSQAIVQNGDVKLKRKGFYQFLLHLGYDVSKLDTDRSVFIKIPLDRKAQQDTRPQDARV